MSTDYYSPKEAAQRLKVNPKLIYAEIAAGRLRAIRIGTKIIRIPHNELETWERAQLEGAN